MAIPISQVAFHHTGDIDAEERVNAETLTNLAYVCISLATKALEAGPASYSDLQRHSFANVFESMRSTHKNIRRLLTHGPEDPGSVDALSLARQQLEALYVVCLMLEGPRYVTQYLHDGWAKQYVQYLFKREEFKDLPRFVEYIKRAFASLMILRSFLGVTEQQQATIDHRELGMPLPHGFVKEPIEAFPTPRGVISRVTTGSRKKVLERLYPEYVRLCSFTHGLSEANFFKTLFSKEPALRNLIADWRVKEAFEQQVSFPAFLTSVLGMIQSTAELTTLYPANIELSAGVVNAWNVFSEASLLGRSIWAIRTKALLGIVG